MMPGDRPVTVSLAFTKQAANLAQYTGVSGPEGFTGDDELPTLNSNGGVSGREPS